MLSDGSLPDSDQTGVPRLTLRDVLAQPHLRGTTVLAGSGGLDKEVSSINIMENPDILPWVKEGELLITVGYSLRGSDSDLTKLITSLASLGLAGFGIKLGRYVTEIDNAALSAADAAGFPILALPTSVSFDDIISDLYAALSSLTLGEMHRSHDIERGLMDMALQGASPAEISGKFSDAIDRGLVYVDAENRILLNTRDPAPRENVRGRVQREELRDAVSAPVVAGSTYVGQVHVFTAQEPSPELASLVQRCAQVMALAASRELAVAVVDHQFHAQLLVNLLRGRLDEAEISRRCTAIEWRLAFPAVVVVVTEEDDDDEVALERAHTHLQRRIRAEHRDAPNAIIDGHIVAIVGDPAFTARAAEDRGALIAKGVRSELPDAKLSCGVSGVIENANELQRGWSQAVLAARVGVSVHGRRATMLFSDLGAYRVLSEVEPAVLLDFAQDTLGELAHEDTKRTDLRDTLRVLLDTNLNIAETARQLYYHYNTVRYRIEQLEKLLGPFMSDASRCVELRLALMIYEMQSVRLHTFDHPDR